MDESGVPASGELAAEPACIQAELIVQNGRLSGASMVLTAPITMIGRAETCDLRLNAESVHPIHCVLAFGSTGLSLRALQPNDNTQVNGQVVTACSVQDGDLLDIGPFQFRVHIRIPTAAATGPAIPGREKDALRIQAAAVTAQQAALTEEEIRLRRRHEALEQQEQQLAALLDEKRRRLVRIRDEAREAHTALQRVRDSYEERVAQIMNELARSRRELADGQTQVQTERQHLLDLRQRLKRRFHRHWAGERMAVRLREAELAKQQRALANETKRREQEKTDWMQLRLRSNSEMEIRQRNLQADRQDVRQQQAELLERSGALDQRQVMLDGQAREIAEEKRRWEQVRFQREQEADGLENRIANSRRKLLDQEREQKQTPEIAQPPVAMNPGQGTSTAIAKTSRNVLPPASLLAFGSQWLQREQQLQRTEVEQANRMEALRQVAGELADQRLHLAEQFERLVLAQHQLQGEREAVLMELEDLGQRLRERDEAQHVREHALTAAEKDLQQRLTTLAALQGHQVSVSATSAVQELAWRGEQDCLMASLRAREDLVEQRLAALIDLRERWGRRRQRQAERLRAQRGAYEVLRRESNALRQELWQRSTLLAKEERKVAERALALEQYRQQWISRARNPKAAERRLERFRRRWAALAVSAERVLARDRKSLERQAVSLDDRARQFTRDADELAGQEIELSARQTTWEQQQLQGQAEQERTRQQLHSLRSQRRSYEQQIEALREEVERLAQHLLAGADPTPLSIVRAA